VQRILVEGPSRRSTSEEPELTGRTECNRIVNFPGGPQRDRLKGQMLDVRITAVYTNSLRAEVCVNEDAEVMATV
jgi:tRNA-2-methylthio-N6-dimethylallyladenosine synthase